LSPKKASPREAPAADGHDLIGDYRRPGAIGSNPRATVGTVTDARAGRPTHIRAFVDRAVTFTACPECGGTRLN
jgi:hypothetical protein